jgi:Fe-S-cluster containining protein
MSEQKATVTPYEKLDALYARLPAIDCKRKCQPYCTAIMLSRLEAKRLEEKRGYLRIETAVEAANRIFLPAPEIMQKNFVGLLPEKDGKCTFLIPHLGTCAAYSIRPLVCRIWGAVNNRFMRCPFGCLPERWLSDAEVRRLHEEIIATQKEAESAEGTELGRSRSPGR